MEERSVVLYANDPQNAEQLMATLPTRLVRKTGVEVRGNWIIDRDFNVVRRRYWGKLSATDADAAGA